jgi:cephalosporin hydroxylase
MTVVESVLGRPIRGALPPDVLDGIQAGVLRMTYRGVPCLKSPFDLALYLLLIQRLRPRTVIEIGTKHGGSALWFADMLSLHGVEGAHVISIDVEPPPVFADDRVKLIRGDAAALGDALSGRMMSELAHPLLVVEDSSHLYDDVLAVLEFFNGHLSAGDYVVVEDGNLSQFSHPMYERFEDGPNRAVAEFLTRHGGEYAIDTELCDYFGYNVTYNPNGWLRRL